MKKTLMTATAILMVGASAIATNNLAGPDLNHDGIRDDVGRYIEQQGHSVEQQSALKAKASALQDIMTFQQGNKTLRGVPI